MYSCPLAYRGRGECHVSLLVTTPHGERYVLDNGAVVNPMIGAQGVTDFESYGKAVQGVYWIGLPPTADDVVAAFGSGARPLLRSAR